MTAQMIRHTDVRMAARLLVEHCHGDAKAAGWWPEGAAANPLTFSNKLMLTVSELAEAMEGDRKSLKDDKLPQYDMRAVELADAAIRIFDLAGAYGYDLGEIMAQKMNYNAHRADHKPEARAAAGGKAY
jgi:NTP pyrophosphatase (non-canonical NTP hydrolase)